MALELAIDPSVFVSKDCKTIGIKDATTNYGNPNPDRQDLALFLQALSYKTDPLGDQDDNQVLTNLDPAIDAVWSFEQDKDGYYKFRLIAVPLWQPGVPNFTDDLVYVQNTGLLYKAIQDSNNEDPEDPGSLFWKVVDTQDTLSNIGLIDNTANVITSPYFDYVLSCRAAKCYVEATAEYTKDVLTSTCNCKEERIQEWQKVHALYNSVLSLVIQERYLEAQEVVEQIATICEELNCGCQC